MTVSQALGTNPKPPLKVLLCSPRGFCAGVVRAIDTVEQALARYGAPVYVRHEIVHNRYVVESLKAKGAIFVEELEEIPDTEAPVIFSAHGVPKSIPEKAKKRNLFALDATCPLVTKVHREAEIHHKRGREIVLIGHADHPEVVGTPNSSNTQRLKEVAERAGCPRAALVQRAKEIDWSVFGAIASLGVTAGASAPEVLVEEVIGAFAERYVVNVETVTTADEDMFFPLPRVLRGTEAAE